jgi:hypothetical protein
MYFIQHCFICCPSDSTVSEDAGIEPRTVATSALAVRRSSHSDYISSNSVPIQDYRSRNPDREEIITGFDHYSAENHTEILQ